jgi:PncC family amidohydrolase
VPRGATVIPPAGTAPGLLLPLGAGHVLVLPGPPRELATVWGRALELEPIDRLRARAGTLLHHTLRVYGVGEPAVARAFAAAGGDAGGTRTTICARAMEVEVTIRAEHEHAAGLDALVAGLRDQLGGAIYAEDERPLAEHVLALLRQRGLRVAVAESCTAGLVAARLTDIPGSSDALLGGVIAYADDVKRELLGVPAALLAEYGSVSAEVAQAMAAGARSATGAEVGISVTAWQVSAEGERKPVGLVHLHPRRRGSSGDRNAPAQDARRCANGDDRRAATDPNSTFVTPRGLAAYPARSAGRTYVRTAVAALRPEVTAKPRTRLVEDEMADQRTGADGGARADREGLRQGRDQRMGDDAVRRGDPTDRSTSRSGWAASRAGASSRSSARVPGKTSSATTSLPRRRRRAGCAHRRRASDDLAYAAAIGVDIDERSSRSPTRASRRSRSASCSCARARSTSSASTPSRRSCRGPSSRARSATPSSASRRG